MASRDQGSLDTGSTVTGLTQHLQSLLGQAAGRDELRSSVLPKIISATSAIAEALRSSHTVTQAGTSNAFGDAQLNVDVISEEILREGLRSCPSVATVSSEEDPVERPNEAVGSPVSSERYTIAFDPLDGSSIIAPNWSVGTIVGIWDGASALDANPREKQVAAVLGVYGPRTTVVVALKIPGLPSACFEVVASPQDPQDYVVARSDIKLAPPPFKTRYFAPANLRAAAEDTRYNQLISNFIIERYTLRYCGGLVPDIMHALVKGHGVYLSPVTASSAAKLRRLYELLPMALILECAGGDAVDPTDGSKILDRKLQDIDERGGIICGTTSEVEKAMAVLLT